MTGLRRLARIMQPSGRRDAREAPPPEFTEEKDGVVCQAFQAEHLWNLTFGEAWLCGLLRHYRRAA